MTVAVVSGVGEVHPSRHLGLTAESLVLEAIEKAIADAGLFSSDIGLVVTESSLTPQMAPFDRIAPLAGLNNVSLTLQTVPVGAGILSSFGVACDMVASGKADHALVYFGLDWGTTPNGPTGYHEGMTAKKIVESPAGFAGPPLYFACAAKRYQVLYGLSNDELQEMLWHVVKAARFNAHAHPNAQQQKELSHEEYLAKAMIAEPLRSVDCSLLSDGAVAIVISKLDSYQSKATPIQLAGWAYDFDPIADMDFYTQSPWLPELPACSRSSKKAAEDAGVELKDLDLFEIYDCFSVAVILQLEALGLCEQGQGAHLCKENSLRYDSDLPVNTHGGLLSHGYLLGAGHLSEAIHQLRRSATGRQVASANSAFVGAGPGRQYTSLILKRWEV